MWIFIIKKERKWPFSFVIAHKHVLFQMAFIRIYCPRVILLFFFNLNLFDHLIRWKYSVINLAQI